MGTRQSLLYPSRADLAALVQATMGKAAADSVRYGTRFDTKPLYLIEAMRQPTRRGTSSANARGSAEDRRRRKLYVLDKFGNGVNAPCAYCGHLLTVQTVTIDRYPIPGRLGGRYVRDNIRPACALCNSEDRGLSAVAEIEGRASA